MKRKGAIACLAALIVMVAATFSFGASSTLEITKTYPENGAKNTTKDNMCVKVYFNHEVGNKASQKANEGKFKIVDSSGHSYPTLVYYSSKNPKYVLMLIDTNKVKTTGSGKNVIKDDTEYTAIIDKDFRDNDGHKLGEDVKISFRTMNQSRNTMVYMVMMFVMFGGMMVFSMKQQQKKAAEAQTDAKEAPFNPYKEAKRTGQSVEEVLAKHEKEMLKKKEKEHHRHKEEDEDEEVYYGLQDDGSYRVKTHRTIASVGCTYKTGRKAIAEAKAEEEARKKAELKATNYGKNPAPKKK